MPDDTKTQSPRLVDVENQKLWNEKEHAVKKRLTELTVNERFAAMKQETKAVRVEAAQRERDANARDPVDGKTYWEKVAATAAHLIGKEFNGYNDWAVAMQGLLSAALELNRAMYYDPINWFNFVPYSDEIGVILDMAKDAIEDRTLGAAERWVQGKLMKTEDLPQLAYNVKLNDQGAVESTQVTKDNQALTGELKEHFDVGFVMWAKALGYDFLPGPDGTRVFKDQSGNVLTNEIVKERNADPDTSLARFLSGRFDLNIGYNPSPAPTPSP